MSSVRHFFTRCIISSELCVSRLAHARATYTHSAAIKTYLLSGIFPFYFYRDTLVSFTRMDKSVATTRLRVRKIGYTMLSAPLSQMITKSKFYIEAEIRLPRFSVIGVKLPRAKRAFQIFLWSRKVRVDGCERWCGRSFGSFRVRAPSIFSSRSYLKVLGRGGSSLLQLSELVHRATASWPRSEYIFRRFRRKRTCRWTVRFDNGSSTPNVCFRPSDRSIRY